jgi:hypothetical protein
MNRLAVLIACLAATASSLCFAAAPAEDPAFCRSMCSSEQNACRAEARVQPKEERFGANDFPERNPFARTAQQQVARPETRALDAAGDQNRKQQRLGSCDSTYQRCTQSCAARAAAPALTPARANRPGVH